MIVLRDHIIGAKIFIHDIHSTNVRYLVVRVQVYSRHLCFWREDSFPCLQVLSLLVFGGGSVAWVGELQTFQWVVSPRTIHSSSLCMRNKFIHA